MKLHTPDWANENIRKLAEIFPSCVTETQNSNGVNFRNSSSKLSMTAQDNTLDSIDIIKPNHSHEDLLCDLRCK